MKLYGLIGYPLGHSFSEKFFREKFAAEGIADCRYRNFPIPSIEELPRMLAENPDLRGFNITIPYKQAVLPYLASLSEEAEAIGAVNCVSVSGKELVGYNTDAYGFRRSLLRLIGEERPRALVLGTGGASRAVCYVLEQLGIDCRLVSRSAGEGRTSYEELTPEIIRERELIVNTTPLGTFPKVEECPDIPYEALTCRHYLYDLVYNPAVTEFLRRGAEHGALTMNGYKMLVGQAEKSWDIWTSAGKE